MKKIKYLIVTLLLMMPTMVLADSSSPSILGYDAVITNKKGVAVENYNIDKEDNKVTIAYNTKVHVYNEYDDIANCEIIDKKEGYPDHYVDIPLKDLAPIKSEVKPNDLIKVNNQGSTLEKENNKFIVINTKGVKLSKGPADIYGKYDKAIPYETFINTTYYINTERSTSWYYVDTDNYKGWLDISSQDFAILTHNSILTFGNVDLKDKDGNTVINVPTETIFNEAYTTPTGIYLKYNGKSGYAKKSDSFSYGYKETEGYLLALEKTSITSMDGESRGTIPANEKVKILYADVFDEFGDYAHGAIGVDVNNKNYYYVDYNGIKGYVTNDTIFALYYDYEEEKIELDNELDLYNYKAFTDDKKEDESVAHFLNRVGIIEKIPKSATVTIYATSGDYDDENKRSVTYKLVKYKEKIGCIVTFQEEQGIEPTIVPSVNPTIPPKRDEKSKKDNTENIIVYAIIGAIILSLTALFTMIVVNKKKKTENKKIVEEKVAVKEDVPKKKNNSKNKINDNKNKEK